MSAFSGFHKVNKNTWVSLFCDFSYFDFWGKPVICKHLKMARKDEQTASKNKESDFFFFFWSLDEKSLSYILALAVCSIIFCLFALFKYLGKHCDKT